MQLPELFVSQTNDIFNAEAPALLDALSTTEASVAIRCNIAKTELSAIAGHAHRVPWCDRGIYLDSRPQFTFDPLLHAGKYYVQDASSMIVSQIVKRLVNAPSRYLDLCAAPGGKTTAAIDALPAGSLVVSNEIMGNRAQVLKENIIKWGNPNCIVTNNDSAAFSRLTGYFDVIAADVPCSGEGMFRKDAEAVAQWTPALVRQCVARQEEIIGNAWPALRPGGLLIYSTCTFNRQENELMVDRIIKKYEAETIEMDFPAEWNIHAAIDSPHHCYRFLPHLTRGEGLFISVIRKPEDGSFAPFRPVPPKKSRGKDAIPAVPAALKDCVTDSSRYSFSLFNDFVQVIANEYADDARMLNERLRIIYSGCRIATLKGKEFVPDQHLALSSCCNRGAFPLCDIGYAQAIAYLRGEAISVNAPRGIVLLTYAHCPIGFVKNLGNRANNLYPKEWRIKSTHSPADPPEII